MTTPFASKEALGELLKSWAPSYEPYAAMFDRGICNLEQLANARDGTLTTLLAKVANQPEDIEHRLHAHHIITRAKKAAAGTEAGPDPNLDCSRHFCQRLLEDAPTQPPSLDELAEFLFRPPTAPVPLLADVLAELPTPERAPFCAAYGMLARTFAASIAPSKSVTISPDASEHMTLLVVEAHVVAPLIALDHAAWPDGLSLQVERNKGDATSLMTLKSSAGASLRPDGVLRDLDGLRMLAKWEDKAVGHSMQEALDDLKAKTAVWTPLYYGNIKYLPCFAAIGSWVQFAAVTPDQRVVQVGPMFDMKEPLHRTLPNSVQRASPFVEEVVKNSFDGGCHSRVRMVFNCIQFFKLLKAQRGCYPDQVLPLCKDLVVTTQVPAAQEHIKRTLYFCSDRLVVRKRIEPWPLMEVVAGVSFPDISRLYSETAKEQGLVHAVEGPSLVGGKYTVTLAPIGRQGQHGKISSEEDVRCMAHGLLHGLAAIHKAGLVHRDVRLENTACAHAMPRRWFLLDLECCALPGQPSAALHTASIPGVLVDGCFTPASDIAMLGRLLGELTTRVTSEDGLDFLKAVCLLAKEQQKSTQELLTHPWLRCIGPHCREAGAQAWEATG